VNFDELQKIISEVFNINRKNITPDLSMKNFSEWDSIGHLNLILALEEKTKLRFTPEQISSMIDVHSILDEILKAKN
jgi:acyl carrier protein